MFLLNHRGAYVVSVGIIALGVACSDPKEPEERDVSVSEAMHIEPPGDTAAAPDSAPTTLDVSFKVPCSDYPVAGDLGPYRLAANSGIVRPRRTRFGKPDVRGLGLNMSEAYGLLLLEVVVSETGSVESVVAANSVHPDFDRQMVEAFKAAEFEPAMRRGKPVAVCMTYSIRPHE